MQGSKIVVEVQKQGLLNTFKRPLTKTTFLLAFVTDPEGVNSKVGKLRLHTFVTNKVGNKGSSSRRSLRVIKF